MLKQEISNWLSEIYREGGLPNHVKAIYIGLFEGEYCYVVHFSGSADFDPDDDDWACEDESDYLPVNRYLETSISTETDWKRFQSRVIEIIKELRDGHELLSQAANIAVGFDDGDLIYI